MGLLGSKKEKMKKIFIPIVITILLQGSYILKLRHDLGIRKEINKKILMQILTEKFDNVKNEYKQLAYTNLQNEELSEPSGYKDSADIIERIEMLEDHLDYNPSKEWIRDVLSSAKINLGM